MKRACRVSLKFITAKKQKQINALLESYRSAVNFYIKSLWKTKGKLDGDTKDRLKNTRLSERYKSCALKRALEIVVSTKKSAEALHKKCKVPVFHGQATLDAMFVTIEEGKGSFDLVVKLSTLNKGNRITIPTRHTKMTRKWLKKRGSKFIQGCSLSKNFLTLWVEIPETNLRQSGKVLGVDMGVNKLMTDSNKKFYGRGFTALSKKIRRKKPGSKAMQRAFRERDNFICREVKKLPWKKLMAIGVEDLRGIKTGKKKDRGKNFRKAMAPWIVRQVVKRIEDKASENRVYLIKVDPSHTSQTCPNKTCSKVSDENRKGEKFRCVACGYKGDADHVGALEILVRTFVTLGSLQSPRPVLKATV